MKLLKQFFTVGIATISIGTAVQAQSIESIQELLNNQKFAEAKAAVDKYLSNPKKANDATAQFYKGFAYNGTSRTNTDSKSAYNEKVASFEAFKLSQTLDANDLNMKMAMYSPYLDLYGGFYDLGAKQFNDGHFADAYQSFSKAQEVEDYILQKGYTYDNYKLNKTDTGLIINTAVAAMQAKDTLNGMKAYKKIVDAGVAGTNYEYVYEVLADYYSKKGDEANLQPLLVKAKALYPNNNFWEGVVIDKLRSMDRALMFDKFESVFQANPTNFFMNYNYAAELFNDLYSHDEAAAGKLTADQKKKMSDKIIEVATAIIPVDTAVDAKILLNNHYYNIGRDFYDKKLLVTGKTPADLQRKKDLQTQVDNYLSKVENFSNQIVTYYKNKSNLRSVDKSNLYTALGYLSDIYAIKGDAAKSDAYRKEQSAIKF